jgi:hypothetical protein
MSIVGEWDLELPKGITTPQCFSATPTAVVFGTEQATFRFRPVPSSATAAIIVLDFFGQRIPRTPSKPKDNVEFNFLAVDPARG